MMNHIPIRLCITFLIVMLAACSSPEEKKMKFFEKGKSLYEQEAYTKARLEIKNALQMDPNFADGYYWLGRTEQKLGNLQRAYGSFLKAVELNPDILPAQLAIVKLLLLSRETEKSLEKIELVLGKEPDNYEARILKGSLLLMKKDTNGAINYLEALDAEGQNQPDFYLTLAAAHTQNKDYIKAEDIYRQGLAENPDSTALYLALARYYRNQERFDEAAEMIQEIIKREPENVTYKINLATLYWDDGREESAIKVVNDIISNDPTHVDFRILAARFFVSKKKPDTAVDILRAGIEKTPKSLELRTMLGELYASLNQSQKAIETLEGCLTLDKDPANPGIITAKNALAKVYLMLRKVDLAEKYVNDVLQQDPKSVDGHFNRGNILLEQAHKHKIFNKNSVIN